MSAAAALGERAKHRLRLAAGLLRGSGYRFDCPRAQFYDVVGAVVRELATEARAKLRADVDWLEAYERAEAGAKFPELHRAPERDLT